MPDPKTVSNEDFKVLTRNAGMNLSDDEIEHLRPMYEFYANNAATLHDVELDDADLALSYTPNWDAE